MNRARFELGTRLAIVFATAGLAAITTLAASQCIARPVEGVVGWEGDGFDQGYGFAMIEASLPGGETISIPIRVNGSYLYYNYTEEGETIDVSGPACAGLVGIRSSRAWGTLAVLTGGEILWERRKRSMSSGETASVARGGVMAQLEGDFAWGKRFRQFLLLNYSGSARYVYGRAGLQRQISNFEWRGPLTWSLGLEGVGQGNADTDAVQGGATVECALVRSHTSLSVRGGYKNSDSADGGRRHGAYFGLGLYRRF